MRDALNADMFIKRYSNISEGPKQWQEIKTENTSIYNWDESSTYVKKPPFFDNLPDKPEGFKPTKNAAIAPDIPAISARPAANKAAPKTVSRSPVAFCVFKKFDK